MFLACYFWILLFYQWNAAIWHIKAVGRLWALHSYFQELILNIVLRIRMYWWLYILLSEKISRLFVNFKGWTERSDGRKWFLQKILLHAKLDMITTPYVTISKLITSISHMRNQNNNIHLIRHYCKNLSKYYM